MSLPQLATQVVGSLPVYELAFANVVPGIGTILETQTGQYNASIAQNIFKSGFCTTTCNSHIPILWNSPVPVAAYGAATIQGDAIGVWGSWLFLAATANNVTSLYFSSNYGTNGSWFTLTGNAPISGGSPKLAVSACNALLTTITSTNLIATRFTLPCGKPWGPPPPPPIPSPPNGGGGHPPSGPGPTVSIVVPSQAANLTPVQINGTGFSSVTMVTFGGAVSSYTVQSTTAIVATVPYGWGTLPVQVTAGGQQSPITCASFLTHGTTLPVHTPEVSSVAPSIAPAGSTVTINGAYFQPTSVVKFGGTTAAGVSLVSPGVLHATVPLGSGTVSVTVTNSVGTSPTIGCADLFTIQAIPSVISVTPDQGPVGQSTIVEGRNFLLNASVYFGSTLAVSSVTNSTLITATAPTGTGKVNVTVRQVGYSSATTCTDLFTYGAAVPSSAPQIEWVTPSANKSFGSAVVAGYNFQSNATVYFGGVPSPQIYYATPTLLQVEVPLGTGSVPVQVSESGGTSLLTCADSFSIQWPSALGNFTTKTWTLPRAVAADPTFIGGNPYTGVNPIGAGIAAGILASNVSDSKILFYSLNIGTQQFLPLKIVPFASFNASSPANSMGQTSLSVTNGTSGQVATVSYGQAVFGLFTTFVNGQYVSETLGSADGGVTWGGPYATAATVGSVRDPEAAISPAGYAYATWRDNSGGSWHVDQAVYWPSGIPLSQPAPIAGSGGGLLVSTGPPSLLVDPYGRAFYAWTSSVRPGSSTAPAGPLPTGGWSYIRYSGAFVSAYSALRTVNSGFNATVAADYENYGNIKAGLPAFRTSVNLTLHKLQNDTTNVLKLCLSQQAAFGSLYPNVTQLAPGPISFGPALPACPLSEGLVNSILFASTGPFTANIYLEVETSNLLEALGLGSMPIPPWVAGLYSPPPLRGGAFVPGTGAKWNNGAGTTVQVYPATLNSGSVFLNASGVFWTRSNSTNNVHNTTTVCGTTSNFDRPIVYSTNLTIKNQAGATTAVHTFNSSTQMPDVYVDFLRGLRNGTWIERVTVVYQDTQQSTNFCPASFGFTNYTKSVSPPASGWPVSFTKSMSGTYTTGLGYYPSNVTLNSTGVNGNSGVMNDTVTWQNTVYAVANAWVNQTSGGTHYNAAWSNGTYQAPEYVHGSGFQSVPVGRTYKFTALTQTKNGSADPTWWPVLNGNQVSVPAPAESLKFVCPTFTQLANLQKLWWYSPSNISNVTADSATITWFSNGNNSGWVDYVLASGLELNQTAQVLPLANGTFEYSAELHGLEPWSVYYTTAHVRTFSSCVQYLNQTTKWRFQTQASIPLAEVDLPYDSVTQTGGGAQLFFQVPSSFASVSTLKNGSLRYFPVGNTSATITMPLPYLPAEVWSDLPNGLGGSFYATTYAINLTTLTANLTYNVSMTLNYTSVGNVVVHGSSIPFTFQYAVSTSGDGLTDSEKTRGWNVTTYAQPWYGGGPQYLTTHVQANKSAWATNGLVDDFVEKAFGLNPNTLDSASSHMLDTWNLTFDLPGSGPSCPAYFQCWSEYTKNPFLSAPYPGGSGSATAAFLNNTTGPHHLGADDSSWYASTGLWSSTRIAYLQALIQNESVGWLRAVIGYYQPAHDWTLTVQGKLSWGANPLSTSTPGDGIADGARVNPLGGTYLNVTISSWNDTGVSSGDGVAAFVDATSALAVGTQTDFTGYSAEVTAGSYNGGGRSLYGGNLNMITNFPVLATEQYAQLNVSLVQNHGGNVSNAVNLGPINVDITDTSVHSASVGGSSSPAIAITYRALTVFSKAPTYILIPGGNATVSSNLPLGLMRYTGEQNFVLLVVNNTGYQGSGSITTPQIPYAMGDGSSSQGTYSVTFSNGLNNILIPRSLLLTTPLGQDLLNASVVNIAHTSTNDPIQPFYNAADWYNRVTNTSYLATHTYVKIYSNTSQNCTQGSSLCGGVPSNSNLESQHRALALQAILTLNISSPGALDDIVAGLVLNTSGNFTNWLLSATPYLSSLGLSQTIVRALADPVVGNDFAYGSPQSSSQSSNLWTSIGTAIWNAVSGFVGALGVFWNAVFAALAYIAYLAAEAAGWLLGALNQVNSVLKAVGEGILWALQQAAAYIIGLVKAGLIAAFTPVWNGIKTVLLALESLAEAASNGTMDYLDGEGTLATAIYNTSVAIAPLLAFGIAVEVALAIGVGLTAPVSIGASIILGLLITVILSLVGSGSVSGKGGGFLNQVIALVSSSLTGGIAAVISAAESAMNATLSSVFGSTLRTGAIQPIPDPPDFVGAVGFAGASGGLLGAAIGFKLAPSDSDAYRGFLLALIGFGLTFINFAYELTQSNGCNNQPKLVLDGILGTDILGTLVITPPSFYYDIKGWKTGDGIAKDLAEVGLGFDIAGLATGLSGIQTDLGCESTAY